MATYYGDLKDENGNILLPSAVDIIAFNRPELKYLETNVKTFNPSTGSNYSSYGGCYYYKKGTTVHIHLGIQSLNTNTGNQVCTMPVGYRPRNLLSFYGGGTSSMATVQAQIQSNGIINVYPGTSTHCNIDLIYEAFN